MGLTRRQFVISAAIASATPYIAGAGTEPRTTARIKSLSGTLLGLSTLNGAGLEASELFRLDLNTGSARFSPLPDYRFGHSLEALADNRWLAVPYGDDSQPCLVLDRSGHVVRQLPPPQGHGFGGHGIVMKDGENVCLHYNQTEIDPEGAGQVEIINARTGKSLVRAKTRILHGHDMVLSKSGHIVIADDGVMDSTDDKAPYVLDPVRPSLHYFSNDLTLAKTVPLQINGSLVHVSENDQGTIIGAVEQYIRRNESGRQALYAMFGPSYQDFMDQFDPDIFDLDVPIPGPIVSVANDGQIEESISLGRHLDPFDTVFNPITKTTCCIFTESNLIAFQQKGAAWRYVTLAEFGLNSPFGLTNIGNSAFIAANGFERGVAILNTADMSLAQYFDVPTQGVKHLSYQP